MAVKTKVNKAKPIHEQIAEAVAKATKDLYQQHSDEIDEMLTEAEDKKMRVGFGVDIDCSESEPVVTIAIRFSASVTDKRVARLDDPAQIKLFNTREETEKPPQGELGDGSGNK